MKEGVNSRGSGGGSQTSEAIEGVNDSGDGDCGVCIHLKAPSN